MRYDLIVLGGGPAGYLAAERAGQAGMKTLCIEKRRLGGTCLNEGCIPTKTLLYSAKLYDGVRHGGAYGVTVQGAQVDHAAVLARKDKVVERLVRGVSASLKASKVQVVAEEGTVLPRNSPEFRVQVAGEIYEASRLLIASGSHPVIPALPGIQEGLGQGFILTNREILQMKHVPRRLAVVGGGVIGLELASYFNSIGSRVTVIEMMPQIAGNSDPELSSALQKMYEKQGVQFLLESRVTGFVPGAVRCEKDGTPLEVPADQVLLSIGRRPNVEGLGLERIGVRTQKGAVVTDEHMQTNIANVYAAGDVNGRFMLAHVAYREAEVAVNHMLGRRDQMRYRAVPSVVYTNPEMASVGETEQSAREKGMDVQVVKLPMEYAGRYVAENEEGGGLCKMVVSRDTHAIVGAQLLCNYASEFIVALAAFIELELPLEDIREIMFPHPAVCEIIREAAFQCHIS